MRPTRPSTLVLAALSTGLLGYVLLRVTYDDLPPVPRYAPASLLVLAVVEGYLAKTTRDRLRPRRAEQLLLHPPEPIVVARYAALAKASSPVGAVVAGGYAALFAYTARQLDKPLPRHDAFTGVMGLAAGILLVAAALFLERVCRVPPREDEEEGAEA